MFERETIRHHRLDDEYQSYQSTKALSAVTGGCTSERLLPSTQNHTNIRRVLENLTSCCPHQRLLSTAYKPSVQKLTSHTHTRVTLLAILPDQNMHRTLRCKGIAFFYNEYVNSNHVQGGMIKTLFGHSSSVPAIEL